MRFLRVLCLPALLAFSLLTTAARAPEAHDISGTYSLRGITNAGENVTLTVAVRLHNYGEADFSNGKPELLSNLPGGKSHGNFESVALGPHANVHLSQTFTIPRSEYEMWRKGAKLRVSISVKSADGTAVTRHIALVPVRAGEGK